MFSQGFNQIWNFSRDFYDSPILNFRGVCPVVATLIHADRQTDMTKVTGALRDYANAPRKD